MKKTKEQAFMESLSAAATMYTVIQNCLQGKFSRCKCFEMRSNCSTCPFRAKDMMKFGRRIVKKYLNDKKYSIDEVRMHNQNVGIIVSARGSFFLNLHVHNISNFSHSDKLT